MDISLPEDRLSRAARRIKDVFILAALAIAAHKSEIADSVLALPAIHAFAASLSADGAEPKVVLQWGGLILVAVCTVLSQYLVDLVLVRSFFFRMIVLKGRNIEGKYVAWAESDGGWVAVFSTIAHDGRGYREHGRVFRDNGLLYATFEIRMTFFDEERNRLTFTYEEERSGRSLTTGHGYYAFWYKRMILPGVRIRYKVLSAFECYYTDDKARSLEHRGWGHRLSSIAVDPAFPGIPFSNFDDWDKQGELAKALLSSPPITALKAQLAEAREGCHSSDWQTPAALPA
jgi:hypothetical protein